MNFPAEWPQPCPPTDAGSPDGEFYRVVKVDPPSPDDFLSYREMGKAENADACIRAGISLFRELQDAEHYSAKYQYLGNMIAVGVLDATHGLVKPTPRRMAGRLLSHHTWWPYENMPRHDLFSIC